MTDGEKRNEIAARIARLSEIRADLVVARSSLQEGMRRLVSGAYATGGTAGGEPRWRPETMRNQKVEPWPTKDELDECSARIGHLKGQADVVLRELADLGVDSALFKLNGD